MCPESVRTTFRIALDPRADAGTRTPDPIITSDVLYQLSYVGAAWISARPADSSAPMRRYDRPTCAMGIAT
jgi:hypothetical protein